MTGWAWFWMGLTMVTLVGWMVDSLTDQPRRRSSLREVVAGPGEPRCACGRFWVPTDVTGVRDSYGKHETHRCQPEGELL